MYFIRKAMRLLGYKIKPEHLYTLWYEDENGNVISDVGDSYDPPDNMWAQVSRFPTQLTETHLIAGDPEEVAACPHPDEDMRKTYGWIDGVEGRKCGLCGGTQTRNVDEEWPSEWDSCETSGEFSAHMGWSEDLALAIANNSDYSLSEAITIAATCCERCMNSLAYDFGLDWGYKEGSKEWEECGTLCQFCENGD